jgi:hypothetical protein
VFLQLLISLVLALSVVLGAARPALSQDVSRSGVETARTDQTAAEMARLQSRRLQKLSEKTVLERTYEAQLREIDRLKRSKASWRRDRQIRASKAASQTTADRLERADGELRAIDGLLRRQRQLLVGAIERELARAPSAARRAQLDRMRAQVTAALRPRVRKILLPDDTLDALADPKELGDQIALIEQAEVELRHERESLRQREDRYERMARLRDLRARASEMSEIDEDHVRRTGGRPGDGRASPTSDDNPEGPPEDFSGGGTDNSAGEDVSGGGDPVGGGNGAGGGTTGGGTGSVGEDTAFEQSSILLTDVVDSSTIDALRRAGRSTSPRTRAEAAARARKQVEARLQRLERSRALIQRHLGKLRRGQ